MIRINRPRIPFKNGAYPSSDSSESLKAQSHQANDDEYGTKTFQAIWNIAVFKFLANARQSDDCRCPTETTSDSEDKTFTKRVIALFHEQGSSQGSRSSR